VILEFFGGANPPEHTLPRDVSLLSDATLVANLNMKATLHTPSLPAGRSEMSKELEKLLEDARSVQMTPAQKEEQRRSFAYGNAKLENEFVTREMIDDAAEEHAAREHRSRE